MGSSSHNHTLVDRVSTGGLCLDCRLQAQCARQGRTAVHHCELWEGDLRIQPPDPPLQAQPDVAPVMGLCCNCDHRGSCSFSATEGGVWYCEEYRCS